MSIKIGQASLGETGGRNQQPGNQNGRELNISNWYNGRWLGILRYKSRKKAERAAQTCEAAIKNRNIGYDMDNRNTAYEAARAVGWDVSRITKPVETDCSALMMLCAVAAGCASVEALYRRQGNSCTTYCMLHDWPATGDFVLLTGSKYLTKDANLLRGDVLVSEGHTVMALEDGKMQRRKPNGRKEQDHRRRKGNHRRTHPEERHELRQGSRYRRRAGSRSEQQGQYRCAESQGKVSPAGRRAEGSDESITARLALPKELQHLTRSDWERVADEGLLDEIDQQIVNLYIVRRLPQMDAAGEIGIDRKTISRRLPHIYNTARRLTGA